MIDVFGLILQRPFWLLALPVLIAVALLAHRRSLGLAAWEKATDPALLAAMQRVGHVMRRQAGWVLPLPLVAGLLLALALSGPSTRLQAPAFRNLNGILVLIDLSPSLIKGGGLDDAQAVAALVLDRSGGRPVGLILYSGEAYLASALTTDAATPESLIGVLDADTMPAGGSRPDKALNLAADVLTDAHLTHADVLLISDGGGLTPAADAAAERLRKTGGRLFTVAVKVTPPAGAPAVEPGALAELAARAGGQTFSAADPVSVAGAVASSDSDIVEAGLAPLFFHDLGRWLILLALLPVFLLFRRTA
ncbi:vWA domain-containing protein [Oryzibacter oryziterrae]|uniref:vWA domain-containing protein n=1 Tax=Oryzibacter oryziterrae TaxID=2766474 RepID=UPI001F2D4EEE|nr:VWA domain-containing protein [Oryzibacter oryziterrae]